MGMPLEAITMVRTVTKIPSLAGKRLGIAHLVNSGISGSRRLEMTEERRKFLGFRFDGSGRLLEQVKTLQTNPTRQDATRQKNATR